MRFLAGLMMTLVTLVATQGLSTEPCTSMNFELRIEEWKKNEANQFSFAKTFVDNKKVTAAFTEGRSHYTETFDGFKLDILSYITQDKNSMTIEQNLTKVDHPMMDTVVGISRNHFSIKDPKSCQLGYINYYVNLDTTTKLRIRMWNI